MAVEDLLELLNTAFDKDSDSNNYKLLSIMDSGFSKLEDVENDIIDAHFVDKATGKNLDHLGSLFGLERGSDETDSHFRVRIKLAYPKITSDATIPTILEVVAAALSTSTERVEVRDRNEAAYFRTTVWQDDLDASGLTRTEFKNLMNIVKPAGVSIELIKNGDFTHKNAGEVDNTSKGYNNIANDYPDAGTYASYL